jgi:hypothetical protein
LLAWECKQEFELRVDALRPEMQFAAAFSETLTDRNI